ncbi:MAG: hypothetical protein ABRQ23_08500 [Syntrophomonadaceae bacterium]
MTETKQPEMLVIAQEKQQLIAEFLRLTEAQAEQIEADNYDSILKLINEKQSIIEKVNCLDLDSLDLTGEQDDDLVQVKAGTQAMMARTLELENQNIAAIKRNQARIFAQLQNAQVNKAAHEAYRGSHIGMEGILVDKKK